MSDSAQIDVAIRLLEFLTETYAIDTGRIYIAGNCWRPWTRWQDTQWRLYFYMSIYTGMRLAELIGLNWSDITGNMLTVRAGAAYVKGKGTIRTDRPKRQNLFARLIFPPPL